MMHPEIAFGHAQMRRAVAAYEALCRDDLLWGGDNEGPRVSNNHRQFEFLMRVYGVTDPLLLDGLRHLFREVKSPLVRESFVRTLERRAGIPHPSAQKEGAR